MGWRIGRWSWQTCLAMCLGIAAVLFSVGVTSARASGGKDSGGGSEMAGAPIRPTAVRQERRRLEEERAMVNALAGRRDPFKIPPPPRLGGHGDPLEGPLPPGSRGLVIGQIKLKGIVREDSSGTMIAVVTSPSNFAYFLHVHDHVYNGVVTRITANSIHFAENRPDTGRGLETREVVLKMGSGRREIR